MLEQRAVTGLAMTLRGILGEAKEDSPEPLRVMKRKLVGAGNSSSATTWLIATWQRDKEQVRTYSHKRKKSQRD